MSVAKGRISDTDLEEVRRRANLAEIASQYMQVRQAGRLSKALCPFHTEKTPSFSIDPAKGLYHCFGCGKGGDVIRLVEELESLSFVEAVELLARKTGVTLHYEQLSPMDRERSKKRSKLVDAHREAVGFYRSQLVKAKDAEDARRYLAGRKLKEETLERFQVGWSPSRWDSLCKHLKPKGFADDDLIEAGLALRTDRGGLVDRFRGRIMFPIFDVTGEPRAFGARRMAEADGPKYLNTAETPIYKKGTVLYGLNWGKSEIVKAEVAIVVEGYTDVIALHQEGVPLAVATCGTALTVDHFQVLRRFSRDVMLALDADQAGRAGSERAAEQAFLVAQDAGVELRVLNLPLGQDPADFVTARGGEDFRTLMRETIPVVQHRLTARLAPLNLLEPEGRSRALRACLPVLAQVRDEIVRHDYARWLAERAGLDYDVVFLEMSRALGGGTAPTPAAMKRTSTQVKLEREALKLALQHPTLVEPSVVSAPPEYFSLRHHQELWAQLCEGSVDPAGMPAGELRDLATKLALEPIEGIAPSEAPSGRLIEEIFGRLQEFSLVRQISEWRARLEKLNPESDPEGYRALFEELIGLEGAKRKLALEREGTTES